MEFDAKSNGLANMPLASCRKGQSTQGNRTDTNLQDRSADNWSMAFSTLVMFRRMLAVVVVFLFCAPTVSRAAAQAADFGFRFEFGTCLVPSVEFPNGATERLDTFNGVFTEHLGGEPRRIVTTPISLTDAQMSTIYQTLENIRFFDYPSKFSGVPAGVQEVTTTIPAPTYSLEVRMDSATHTVMWNDQSKPSSVEADRLRTLFSMMLGFIHEHPEFKRLPPATIACE